MADHKIKISGDFSSLTQGFKNLSDSIAEISSKKHKIKFDDDESKGFIKNLSTSINQIMNKEYKLKLDGDDLKDFIRGVSRDMDEHHKKLENKAQRLTSLTVRTYKEMQKAYENGTDPRRADMLRQRFERLNKALNDTTRQLKTISQSQASIQQTLNPPAQQGQGGMMGMLGKLRGMPGIPGGGTLGRLGALGRVLGPAGLALGAGAAALGTAYALGDTRRQITPDNLQLLGMGQRGGGDLERIRETGIRTGTGFTPIESVRQAIDIERAVGAPSQLPLQELGGRTILEEAQRTAREYGVAPEEVTQMSGQLRNIGFQGGDSLRKLQDIFTQGTAAGVERARLPDWARQQVGLLEEQAATGSASVKGLEALNALLSRNKFFSDNPQRTLSVARGLDSAFKQQQGPGAIAAFDVINKMTGGNLSPFQAVRMKRLGLFKAMEEMQQQGMVEDVGTGIKKFVETLGELKLGTKIDVTKLKKGTDEFAAMALALQDIMGVEDITLVEQMLEALANDKKITEDWMKSKTTAAKRSANILERVMASQDAAIQRLEASIQEFKMDTGDIANAITTGLHQFVDNMLSRFKDSIGNAFSKLNPFNVDNMMQKATERLNQAQQAALPKAQQLMQQSGGDRSKAVEMAKNRLIMARQKFREIGSSIGDFIPGIEGDREGAEREMRDAKMTLENLLGRRFNLGEEQNLQFDPSIAAPIGEKPLSKEEVEKLQKGERIGRPTSAEVSEQDRMSLDKGMKEESKLRQEEQDKLQGKKPAYPDRRGGGQGQEQAGLETIPGTNVLITPMNRLRDSMDRLADVIERQQMGGSGGGSRGIPTRDKRRIGN